MNQIEQALQLPLFPLRNTVLFPFVVGPFSAGRPISLAAIEAAVSSEEKSIAVFAQKDIEVEVPQVDQLFNIGTRAVIKQLKRSDETIELILQGVERVKLLGLEQTAPYLRACLELLPMPEVEEGTEAEALQQELISLARQYQSMAQPVAIFNIDQAVSQIHDSRQLVYFLAMIPSLDVEKAQKLLEANTRMEAMQLLHGYYLHEIEVLKVRKKISGQVQSDMERQQREHVLRQQLRAIRTFQPGWLT